MFAAVVGCARHSAASDTAATSKQTDYLLDASPFVAQVARDDARQTITVENGLVRRVWKLAPNAACISFINLATDQEMLRSVRPEARVTVDNQRLDVGGLVGQPNHAYLTEEWIDQLAADPQALQLIGVEIGKPKARFEWMRRRHHAPDSVWPPKGVYVRFDFAGTTTGEQPVAEQVSDTATIAENPPSGTGAIRVSVHYELYDGLPAFSKRITVENHGDQPLLLNRFRAEELAVVEHTNWVEAREGVAIPSPDYLHVETDFAFGAFTYRQANCHAVHWRTDPLYTTQVNYHLQTPCLLVVEPTYGPAQQIPPGETFESLRVFELVYDDTNRERRGLALRRFYRTVAPWVTENPITHHLLSNDPDDVRRAIGQAAEVGFEAIIMSFGSGFDMENQSSEFLETWKQVADYAEEQQVELGSYSLFSSRQVAPSDMIQSPPGQQPKHLRCPAVTSPWGQQWLATIRNFYSATGFDQFENDGPYPGDVDVTPRPPLQQGIDDSQWVQWRQTAQLYHDLRSMGVYINAPDYYYLSGSNKCGMGYREVNWSLPRAQQVVHTRQNIYDGTWTKTPSMGWMFVPLAEYHGGGAAATIEPLHQHQEHYRRMLQSNLGMGVQAHYRGPRLFDTPQTREMVAAQVAWFKKYRDILESDIVHGRRADGRDLDWILHVNPHLPLKGMLCVYNPLDREVTRSIAVNVYYTGLEDQLMLSPNDEQPSAIDIDSRDRIQFEVTVPAGDMVWYTLKPWSL